MTQNSSSEGFVLTRQRDSWNDVGIILSISGQAVVVNAFLNK